MAVSDRDPLDQLIADLERSIPAAPEPKFEMGPSCSDYWAQLQSLRKARDPAVRQRLAADPATARVNAYHERQAREREADKPVKPAK